MKFGARNRVLETDINTVARSKQLCRGWKGTIFQQIHCLHAVFDLVTVGKPLCAHRWEGRKIVLCDQILNTSMGSGQMADLGSYA